MDKATIFLPIEIKYRELYSKILIAYFSINYGMRCYIGSKNSIMRMVRAKRSRGGIFLYKGGLSFQSISYLKRKFLIAILDEEIGPATEELHKEIIDRIYPNTHSYIDRYYCIGSSSKKIAERIFANDHVFTSGWPRIDLWRQNFQNIYVEQIDDIKRKFGEYILLSSDIGVNSEKKIKDSIDCFKNFDHELTRAAANDGSMERIANQYFNEYKTCLQLLYKLDNIKDCPRIIIRPHPSEDHAEWQRVAKTFKRIKVIYKGEVSPWIYAASAVLHRGCTSAVQAYMAGVPAGYIVTKEEWIKQALPYHVSEHLYSAEDIANFCKKFIDHKPVPPTEYSEAFKNVIHIDKDKFASELIVEDMLKLGATTEPPYQAGIKDVAHDALLTLYSGLLKAKQRLFKTEQKIGIAPQSQKMPGGITKKEVEDFLRRIDPNRHFIVRQVFRDCVEIEG